MDGYGYGRADQAECVAGAQITGDRSNDSVSGHGERNTCQSQQINDSAHGGYAGQAISEPDCAGTIEQPAHHRG